jgi:hypothetical protein
LVLEPVSIVHTNGNGKSNGAVRNGQHLTPRIAAVAARNAEVAAEDRVARDMAAFAFDYWRAKLDHGDAVYSPSRAELIKRRISEGWDRDRPLWGLSRVLYAIDGCRRSDFHMNKGPRANGKKYDSIELICRSTDKVEDFASDVAGYKRQEMHAEALAQAATGAAP